MPKLISIGLTDFEIGKIESDAKHKTVCQRCFGTGQLHHMKPMEHWDLCPICSGEGRAPGEPHVLRLIDELRTLLATAEELAQNRLLDSEHRELLIADYEEKINRLEYLRAHDGLE